MTIKEAQELVEAWNEKNDVNYNELTNMAVLTEEIGKLAIVLARRFGDYTGEGVPSSAQVSAEVGDILWALVSLSNQTKVDLTYALAESLSAKESAKDQKKRKR